MSYNLLAYLLT